MPRTAHTLCRRGSSRLKATKSLGPRPKSPMRSIVMSPEKLKSTTACVHACTPPLHTRRPAGQEPSEPIWPGSLSQSNPPFTGSSLLRPRVCMPGASLGVPSLTTPQSTAEPAKLGTVAEGSRRVACPTGAELGEVVNAVRSRDCRVSLVRTA